MERRALENVVSFLRSLGYLKIAHEHVLSDGSRVDIAALDEIGRPLVIVEVKARALSLGERRLSESLRLSNANYGILTDGITSFYYMRSDVGGVIEIPTLPRPNESVQEIVSNLRQLNEPAYKFWRIANVLRSREPSDIEVKEIT